MPILTATTLRHLDICERRVWLDFHGDHSQRDALSDFAMQQFAGGIEHENTVRRAMVGDVTPIQAATWDDSLQMTQELMREGVAGIAGASFEREIAPGITARGSIDWLRRINQPSRFGRWAYEPIEIKQRAKLQDADKIQLDFYLWLLNHAEVNGWFWLSRDEEGRPRSIYEHELDEARLFAVLRRAIALIDPKSSVGAQYIAPQSGDANLVGEWRAMPTQTQNGIPPIFLGAPCKNCHWYSACTAAAQIERDFTLIPGLQRETWEQMRANGIRTVDDVAARDTRELQRFKGIGKHRAQEIRAHAQALIDNRPMQRQPLPEIARQPGVMLDIETRLDNGLPWCFGFMDRDGRMQVAVVAARFSPSKFILSPNPSPLRREGLQDDSTPPLHAMETGPGGEDFPSYDLPDGQRITIIPDSDAGWRLVAATGKNQPVYHWSGYELDVLRKTGPPDAIAALENRLHDLHRTFKQTVTIPIRGTSIKKVGPYLGYHWPQGVSALTAWADYQAWLLDNDKQALARACAYQRADVEALDVVWKWLNESSL
jgi:predicted RecB family nuclease